MKSVLVHHQVVFTRTHDLSVLLALLQAHAIAFPLNEKELQQLNPFAVTLRYEEESASLSRNEAKRLVEMVMRWSKESL